MKIKPAELEAENPSTHDSVAYDCQSRKQKRKIKPITMLDFGSFDWLVLPLLPPTPKIYFSPRSLATES